MSSHNASIRKKPRKKKNKNKKKQKNQKFNLKHHNKFEIFLGLGFPSSNMFPIHVLNGVFNVCASLLGPCLGGKDLSMYSLP
jgi:hypothetical protein